MKKQVNDEALEGIAGGVDVITRFGDEGGFRRSSLRRRGGRTEPIPGGSPDLETEQRDEPEEKKEYDVFG